jgi:hypothetical protein
LENSGLVSSVEDEVTCIFQLNSRVCSLTVKGAYSTVWWKGNQPNGSSPQTLTVFECICCILTMASPDSIPSLSAISSGSCSDDLSPVDDVAKKLVFETPKRFQSKWGDAIANIALPPSPTDLSVSESIARTDFALDDHPKIAAAQPINETEIVQSNCNLAIEEPQGYSASISEFTHSMDVFGPAFAEGWEDLSRKNKTAGEFFTKFDLSEEDASFWPPRPMGKESVKFDTPPNDDDITVVTKNTDAKQISYDDWRSKREAMEMEVIALKEVIRVDSMHILKLKRGLDHAKEAANHHLPVIKVLTSKLRVSKRDHGNSVKAAQQHEIRARQDKETIATLNAKVTLLTKTKTNAATTKKPTDEKEVQHLRYENDLFATHIIENETEMKRLKVALETKETAIVNLALAMENMKKAAHVGNLQDIESKRLVEVFDLKSKLEDLTLNLDRAVANSRTELKTKDRQIREIKLLVEIVLARQNEQGSDKIHSRAETSTIVKHIVSMDRQVEVLVETLRCRDTEVLELKKCVIEAQGLSSPNASSTDTATTADSTPLKRFKGWFGNYN